MGELLTRRREMAQAVSGDSALYSLTNVSEKYDGQWTLTVTKGNHVYLKKRWGTANTTANISNWSNAPFSLQSGDEVKVVLNVIQRTTGNFRIQITNCPNFADITTTGENVQTVTASASGSVSSISVRVTSGSANKIIEFDIEVYVNDVRYV